MRCEDCGDSISLSNAYRDDDGNFVCEECHTDDQQQRQQRQSQTQQRTQSTQQQRAASVSTEKQTEQNSSGGSSSAPTQRARTPRAETQTPVEGQPSERRFKTLLSIGKFVSGAGWVIVGLGALAAIIGIISAMSQAGNRFGGGQAVFSLVTGMGGGLWAAVTGILMVAYGQLVSCFVAIEHNTRSTYRLIQERGD